MELLLRLTSAAGTAFLLEEGEAMRHLLSRGRLQINIGRENLYLVLETFARRVKGQGTVQLGSGTISQEGEETVLYFMGAPVTLRGQEIGIMLVTNCDKEFTREDKYIFSLVITHLERIVQTTEPREYKFFLDNRLVLPDLPVPVQNLRFSLDLRELLLSVADLIGETMDYDVCLLFLPEGSGDLLRTEVLRVRLPEGEVQLESHYSTDTYLFSLVYERGNPLLVVDISKDQHFEGWGLQKIVSSIMAAPIVDKDENLGVLLVGSQVPGNYDQDDLKTLCAFAYQVGVLSELAANANYWEGYQYQIIESVPAAIISIDKKGYITTYNSGARHLFGIPGSEVKGYHYRRLLGKIREKIELDELLPELEARVEQALKRGIPYEKWDLQIPCRRGKSLFVNLSFSPILDCRRRILGATLVIEDVTEKRQLEISLQEAEKLAALGELAAGIAHEMRNPLTTIKGFTQLIRQKNYSAEELAGYTDLMLSEMERMGEIIRSLLLLADTTRVQVESVDLNKLLELLLSLIHAEAVLRDVEIRYRPSPNLPPVKGDFNELKQSFLNIATNALQAMTYGGILTISSEYRAEEGEVWIHVGDTGCGIAPDDYKRIFNPFFCTKEEGTGLGLPIAYRIVQKYGGEINIASKVGEGTVFTIKLPAEKEGESC
ncbi:MAG TPA: GAF domain-containing protein [Firmicutes bacterium]|nr:GAF domain-containing protein [Bacillota bacterium]